MNDEVNVEAKLKSLEMFEKRFKEEKEIEISYDEFSSHFFVESYFFSNSIPFMRDKFYETIFDMMKNLFKNYLQEFEYYNNLKGGNKIMDIDSEVLRENIEKTQKYYLKLHLEYKKFHIIALNFKTNDVKVIEFLNKVFSLFIEINSYTKSLQEKMIANLEGEIKKIGKNDKSPILESSMYNY